MTNRPLRESGFTKVVISPGIFVWAFVDCFLPEVVCELVWIRFNKKGTVSGFCSFDCFEMSVWFWMGLFFPGVRCSCSSGTFEVV